MTAIRNSLGIDFGSRYIGLALVSHEDDSPNRVLYATTITVDSKPLNDLVTVRSQARRIRRTRKTHRRRLRRLAESLHGIAGAERVVQFCRRRGFSHEADDTADPDPTAFRVSREQFFEALDAEVARIIVPDSRNRVLSACSKHLNGSRRRDAELRPARFMNRGPTKCNWEGCHHNVPKAENEFRGRLRQALFLWMQPIFAVSADRVKLRRSVEHWVGELGALAHAYQNTNGSEKAEAKVARKPINRRKARVFRNLLSRVEREAPEEIAAPFAENWKEHYADIVTDIIKGGQAGRVRYCRQHSIAFVEHVLAGKQIPNRTDISEADLISRKQQIVFRRLWRLIEARILPLAGGRIDRVVVERVAFDVLAGPFKARQDVSEPTAANMYWEGPQFGFASRRDMLREEFGGRCAYCDDRAGSEEVEHLLPRSAFPFDSYFNILPACAQCNARKGARTPVEAGMSITDGAFDAYCKYVGSRKPVPHVYHTMKKGLLNLLRRSATAGLAERMLGMIANNLVTVTATQRSPRPLARYLAGKLEAATGHRPDPSWSAGRHTALYRAAILPQYSKPAEKEQGDLRNHAVDAIILACELPSATALENRQWNGHLRDMQSWFDKVRAAGPALATGLPKVEPSRSVAYFETDLGDNFRAIDLAAFNWNRRRRGIHGLDPFGVTPTGEPLKRVPAAKVLAELIDGKKRKGRIEAIAHPVLRKLLQAAPADAAERFVQWLQQTCNAGQAQRKVSNHPADQLRDKLLAQFIESPSAEIISGTKPVPHTIGIRCVNAGSRGQIDVTRSDSAGRVFQHYKSDPIVREMYVGYCTRNGSLDRSSPVMLFVDQSWRVKVRTTKVKLEIPPDSPLNGRSHGSRKRYKDFMVEWRAAFDALCAGLQIAKRFRIVQGCVIEKMDGTRFQLRNFDKSAPWSNAASFKEIRRVFRSPLTAAPGSSD